MNDTTARIRVRKSFHGTPDYTTACRERGSLIFCARFDLAEVTCLIEMPGRGLEPLRISPPDPKSGASANSATPAYLIINDLQISLSLGNAFVLELWCERPCNAKKSRIAAVDTPPLGQCLRLAIIAPSLSPHATLAIAESQGFTSVGTATTRSFGSMSGTAEKHRGVFRSAIAIISRCKLSRRSRSARNQAT